MDAAGSSETLVTIYQNVRRCIPEGCNFQVIGIRKQSGGVESKLHSKYITHKNLDR
jgi:hypothetical protein